MADDNIIQEEATVEEITAEDGQLQIVENILPRHLTILPLTQRPIFPGLTLPLTFSGNDKLDVLKKVMEEDDGYAGLVLTKELDEEDYTNSEFHSFGTVFQILRMIPIAPGTVQVLGRGVNRFQKEKVLLVKPTLRWQVKHESPEKIKPDADLKAYMMAISSEIKELLKLNPLFQEQVNMVVSQLNYDAPGLTMDVISNLLSADSEVLQDLLDRMEVIRLSGYVLEDKVAIAKQYLVPKQLREHGFEEDELQISDAALALFSLAIGQPVKEGIAMTGELTLTGKVLPIGGVKEKTIAARRVGVKELILPIDNRKDFEELEHYIKQGITVHYADYFDDVLKAAYPALRFSGNGGVFSSSAKSTK